MLSVTIQPNSTTGKDTRITGQVPDNNFGIETVIMAGTSVGQTHTDKGLIQFDLSPYMGAEVTSATLRLYCVSEQSVINTFVSVRRGFTPWHEGSKNNAVPSVGENATTWNHSNTNGSVGWSGSAGGGNGTDYSATATDQVTISVPSAYYDFNVLSDVQGFVTGAFPNYGWWLLGDTSQLDTRKHFASSEHATEAFRPQLILQYRFLHADVQGTSTVTGNLQNIASASHTLSLQPNAAEGKDTTLAQGVPNNNFGSNFVITAGANTRALLRFDLSDIPETAIILSAELTLYSNTPTATNVAVNIYRSFVEWFEGNGSNSVTSIDGSTWNNRNHIGSVAWTGSAGGAAGIEYAAISTDSTIVNGTGYFSWDVTLDVAHFVHNPSDNHGWWMDAVSTRDFFSSDEAQANRRPQLTISYILQNIEGSTSGSSVVSAVGSRRLRLRGEASGEAIVEGFIITNEYTIGSSEGEGSSLATLKAFAWLESTVNNFSSISGEIFAKGYAEGLSQGHTLIDALIISNEWLEGIGAGSTSEDAEIQAVGYLRASPTFSASSNAFLSARWYMEASLSVMGVAAGDPTGKFRVEGSTAGSSVVVAQPDFQGRLRAFVAGTSSLSGTMFNRYQGWGNTYTACNSTPLLYLTDGSIRPNGQLNLLNFLSEGSGFKLRSWRPKISQYKEGGRFSSGPLAQGRRLRYRNFDNVIETFELTAIGQDQDALIEFQQELMGWQEAAADYWVSDFVVSPVYLVAKAARETHERYAIIHMISVPELENPYTEPFFGRQNSVFETITPQIERGHWLSTPPGHFECVPISSIRSWTVSGWESGS